jgi:hypothetical protein
VEIAAQEEAGLPQDLNDALMPTAATEDTPRADATVKDSTPKAGDALPFDEAESKRIDAEMAS